MFCTGFLPVLSDITPYFHFRYFARATLLGSSIHSAVACMLAMSCVDSVCAAKDPFEPP